MKKKKIKGFTLIELLAVVVVLAIILVIAIPKIMNIIAKSKISSMESTAKLAVKAVERSYEVSLAGGEENTLSKTGSCMDIANLDTDEYDLCTYKIDDGGRASVTVKGKDGGRFNELICYDANKDDITCNTSTNAFIVFNPTGGKNNGDLKVVKYNKEYGFLPTPTRSFYRFDGWYTEKNGGEKIEESSIVSGDYVITLYAHWTYLALEKTLDVELTQGYEYDDGTYIYHYMQEYSNSGWYDIPVVGWGITLKDKTATEVNVDPYSKINGIPIISAQTMFYNATKLTKVKLDKFDTSNILNMEGMFYNCNALQSLDLTNFDTSKVRSMTYMFFNCFSLPSLDLSSFDTGDVMLMLGMFAGYTNNMALTEIKGLESWDVSSVQTMVGLFQNCTKLTTLNFSKWDTSSLTNMQSMFGGCTGLTSLIFGEDFDTSNVTSMSSLFFNCTSLKTLDVSSFNTSKVTDMYCMFAGNISMNLESIIGLENFDTSNVLQMTAMFQHCDKIVSLNLSSFNTAKVTIMAGMFFNCYKLASLDLSNFDTSNVTDMSYMFCECRELASLNVSNFNTSKVTNMDWLFTYCAKLATVDLSSFDTSAVTKTEAMFYGLPTVTINVRSTADKTKFDNSSYKPSNVTFVVKA